MIGLRIPCSHRASLLSDDTRSSILFTSLTNIMLITFEGAPTFTCPASFTCSGVPQLLGRIGGVL
jgi:hypothetical protein